MQVHKKQCSKINAYFVTSGLNRRKLNDFTRTNIEGTEEVEKKDSDEDTKESNDSCCCPNSECQIGVTELLTENLNYTLRTGSSAPWRCSRSSSRTGLGNGASSGPMRSMTSDLNVRGIWIWNGNVANVRMNNKMIHSWCVYCMLHLIE